MTDNGKCPTMAMEVKPKFKVGDRVKSVHGSIGIVEEVDDTSVPYRVAYHKEGVQRWECDDILLALADIPKYEIGSLWKHKEKHKDEIFTLMESPYHKTDKTQKSHCLDSKSFTLYRNLEEINEEFEPYTENEWNDYDPDVEPEVGRWVEWSDDETDGKPTKTRRVGITYSLWNPNYKVGAPIWEWCDFRYWGQWRYCEAPDGLVPDIDVVTKTEANDLYKPNTISYIPEGTNPMPLKSEEIGSEPWFQDFSREMYKEKKVDTAETVQKMHNAHYTKLEPHQPIDVYATWVNANPIFKEQPELAGYYLNIIKYMARLDMKQGEHVLTNLHKAKYYIDQMMACIKIEERNNDQ